MYDFYSSSSIAVRNASVIDAVVQRKMPNSLGLNAASLLLFLTPGKRIPDRAACFTKLCSAIMTSQGLSDEADQKRFAALRSLFSRRLALNGNVVGVLSYVKRGPVGDSGSYHAHALIPAKELANLKGRIGSFCAKKLSDHQLSDGQVNSVLLQLEHTTPSEISELKIILEQVPAKKGGRFAGLWKQMSFSRDEERSFEPGDREWISMLEVYHSICQIKEDCVGLLVSYESDDVNVVFSESRRVLDPQVVCGKVLDMCALYEALCKDSFTVDEKKVFECYLRIDRFRDWLHRDEFFSLLHFLSDGDVKDAEISRFVAVIERKFAAFSALFDSRSSAAVYGVNFPCACVSTASGVREIIMTGSDVSCAIACLETKFKIESCKRTSPEKFALLPLNAILVLFCIYFAGYRSMIVLVMLCLSIGVCLFGVFGVLMKKSSKSDVLLGGTLGDLILELLISSSTRHYDKVIVHLQRLISSLKQAQNDENLILFVIQGSDSKSYRYQSVTLKCTSSRDDYDK